MKKQRIEYDSAIDALIAVTKKLHTYEMKYNIDAEEFYNQFHNGEHDDTQDFIEWANAYQHYLALHHELDKRLSNVA